MTDRKVLLVAFNGESMCFVHVLLNAMDMKDRGFDVGIVIEGTATRAASELDDEAKPFGKLYSSVRAKELIVCACKACAAKMGVLEALEAQGLTLCDEMSGHPSLGRFIEQGWEILTF